MPPPRSEMGGVAPVRCALEALAVALGCGFFLWPLRLYGFDLIDEGTQLAQISRVANGERPYFDFETGYTPGYFAFQSWLLQWGGGGIEVMRTFAVLLQCLLVGLLWIVVRIPGGALVACGTVFLYVAFLLPFSLRSGAPFTIPYPGWLVAPLALLAQAAVAAIVRGSSRYPRTLALLCGGLAGLAFSLKPNSGLLMLAGVSLALVPGWDSSRGGNRWIGGMLGLAAVVGTAVLLSSAASFGFVLPLFVPVVVAALCARPEGVSGPNAFAQLGALGGGFVVVVLPWFVPLAWELGFAGVARDVLLLGGGVIEAYLLPFAAPSLSTCALAIGGALACLLLDRDRALLGLAALTVVGMVLGSYPRGALETSENVLLWLAPLVVVLGLVARRALLLSRGDVAVLVFLAIFSLQLFPRPDPIHVAMGGAPLAYGAARVWSGYAARWRAAAGGSLSWVPASILGLVLLLAIARAAPAALPLWRERVVPLELGPAAPVGLLERHAPAYDWATGVLREIRSRSQPGEAVFLFPDVAGLGFLAQRSQPFYYLYFVPGRPDEAGERRALARLEALAPTLVVNCRPHVEAFAAAPRYFSRLGEFFERAYAPAVEIDGCAVLSRRLD